MDILPLDSVTKRFASGPALARFLACAVTPAPETFTWVPVVCWFAQKGATGNAGSFATNRAR